MRATSSTRRAISALRRLAQLQAEAEVRAHGQVRVERVGLEDHRDVALARVEVGDVALADEDAAVGDLLDPRDQLQQRRLAAAGRADEHHELAVADLERDVVDRVRARRPCRPCSPRRCGCSTSSSYAFAPVDENLTDLEPVVQYHHVRRRARGEPAEVRRGPPPARGPRWPRRSASSSGTPSAVQVAHGVDHRQRAARQLALGAAHDAVLGLDPAPAEHELAVAHARRPARRR